MPETEKALRDDTEYGIITPMNNEKLIFEDECYAIRGAIYEVYRELGNGFREEVYQQCLEREFAMRGIPYEAKRELRIFYKGTPIEKTYVPDFICYDKIIVELKAVRELEDRHRSQAINYAKVAECPLAILINFGENSLKFERFPHNII